MKRSIILISILTLIISSCQDKRFQTYMANVPTYMSYEDLRASFEVKTGEELVKPGKIYFKDQYMYINEYQKGIHIVDLSEPSTPEIKA
ncbi:MAG: hypothetical protein KAT15_29435, partial [Bacteroidales bacterium]|nr:hypothetical protein [Bacteroidales bacterium]